MTPNLGATKNFLKAVELARGEFVWILAMTERLCDKIELTGKKQNVQITA